MDAMVARAKDGVSGEASQGHEQEEKNPLRSHSVLLTPAYDLGKGNFHPRLPPRMLVFCSAAARLSGVKSLILFGGLDDSLQVFGALGPGERAAGFCRSLKREPSAPTFSQRPLR
jgi:hypothetical protein